MHLSDTWKQQLQDLPHNQPDIINLLRSWGIIVIMLQTFDRSCLAGKKQQIFIVVIIIEIGYCKLKQAEICCYEIFVLYLLIDAAIGCHTRASEKQN